MRNPFELFEDVQKATGITKIQLQGRQRPSEYVRARVMYSRLARAEGYSYPEIGRHLKKDHTTIVYHINGYNDRTDGDKKGNALVRI